MESRKIYYLKIFASVLFASAILGAAAFVCIKGDLKNNVLSFSCICACLLLSLLFIRLTAKKVIFSLALAVNVAADVFLVLMPSEKNLLIGVCLLAGVQALYLLYTLFLIKGNGLRVICLALRVGLCLLAYFLLPQYFVLTTVQLIYAMIVINAFATLVTFLFFFKTQWVAFLGFLLLCASSFVSAVLAGWATIFKIPLDILTIFANPFLSAPGLDFVLYVPAVLLLALASVWEIGKSKPVAKVAKAATPAQPEKPQAQETKPQPKEATVSRATTTEGMSTISLDDL